MGWASEISPGGYSRRASRCFGEANFTQGLKICRSLKSRNYPSVESKAPTELQLLNSLWKNAATQMVQQVALLQKQHRTNGCPVR
jgi:hypothetical protein